MEIYTEELLHILLSVLAIALALAIFQAPSLDALTSAYFIPAFIVLMIAVGSGFVFHELMHRYVARKFGAWAGYQAWPSGLVLMLVLAGANILFHLGFIFLAPGAVMIYAPRGITKQQNGLISVAGPVTNIVLGMVFFAVFLVAFSLTGGASNLMGMFSKSLNVFSNFSTLSLLEKIAYTGLIGFSVNMNLALFNMIPIPPLDGSKVIAWDWRVWLAVAAIPLIITLFVG